MARLLPVLCLAVMAPLTACGGGGGGGGDSASPQPAPEQPASPDPEPDPEPQTPEPEPEPEPAEPAPRDPPPEDVVVVPPPAAAPAPPPPSSGPPPASDPAPAPPPLPTAADFAGHGEYCAGKVLRLYPNGDATIPCRNWGLGAVGAAAAYARIAEREGASAAPGSGVTVGFIDTGLDTGHWEFDGSRVAMNIIAGDGDVSGTSVSHGTQVASTVGARRDGGAPESVARHDFHGVAWGARLHMFAINLGSGDRDYEPVTVDYLKDDESGFDPWLTGRLREALRDIHGVDILNMSFSVQGLAENYDADDITDALDDAIAVASQPGRADADKTLLVWSAGNMHGATCDADAGITECVDGKVVASSPGVANALPVFVEALRGHAVSVAATRPDGELAWFSNRCGKAAKWCIAAPGRRVSAAWYGPYEDPETREVRNGARGYTSASGTSFSAPLVAGGLAVLKHYFRNQLGNTELLARLYATADVTPDPVADGAQCPAWLDLDGDLSDCELSSTHGRGIMDLDAATRPVGTTIIALGSALAGDRAPALASLLRGGGAAGDALSSAFRGREMAVFDSLGAPFWLDMDGFARAAARPAIGERLARFTAGGTATGVSGGATVAGGVVDLNLASARLRVGVNRPGGDGDWPDGHASLVPVREGGVSLTLGRGALRASAFAAAPPRRSHWWAQDTAPRPTAAGAELAWAPPDSAFALRLGSVREFESALGATGTGAFGRLESGLVFAGVGARGAVEGWSVAAGAELGVAAPQASRGLVSDVSSLATSAFSVSAERPVRDGGRLRLSLSQPLRVESGRMRLSVPVGRTKHGGVARRLVDAPLSPSGRQLDLAADWRAPVDAAGGEARLGATLSVHPGHAVGDAPELVLLAGYRLPF